MFVAPTKTETRRVAAVRLRKGRRGFTLIEILVVVGIILILMGMMGVVLTNSIRKAREAATIALIQKIEGLLDERIKGFERATKSRDFQRIVETITQQLKTEDEDVDNDGTLDPGEDLNGNNINDQGVLRLSPTLIAAIARKQFFRENFPQRFEDLAPNSNVFPATTVLPAVMSGDPAITYVAANHRRRTESAALLYYVLTEMQIFGVPPVGDTEFKTSEVRDTDGDGLMEFVDGWGRPLRFYRWPTRLLKPNGPFGINGTPAGGGTFATYGSLGSDDVVVPSSIRSIAALLMAGLPSGPVVAGQWDSLSEDPDDPYGLITTELKRQFAVGIYAGPAYPAGTATSPSRFQEPYFPTLDTYHTPLVISVGGDGSRPRDNDTGADTEIEEGLGLFEPFEGTDSNSDGIPDTDLGILAQPRGLTISGGTYDTSAVMSPLSDNLTNRNRRAGKGK